MVLPRGVNISQGFNNLAVIVGFCEGIPSLTAHIVFQQSGCVDPRNISHID